MTAFPDPSLLLDDLMTWADDQGITLKLFERADGAWEVVTLALTPDSQPGALRAVFLRLARSANERRCVLVWATPTDPMDFLPA